MPLAIDGGPPVREAPLPSWPAPGDDEVAAAERVVRSGALTYWAGREGRAFEAEYAETLVRAHGIAVANGTLALELALRAFQIGPGAEVIVPSRSFIATASAAVAVGARPVFADIDRDSSCLTADTVAPRITPRTRAIIVVHLGGWPAEMAPIVALARQHGLVVIEDCAQAHGGSLDAVPLGGYGDAACFSFCQDKIVPTGEGGLVVLDDDEAYRRAWEYKDHGTSLAKVSDPAFMGGTTAYKWLHDTFGSNWRLAEVLAALGRVGLAKLPEWHAARTRNALRLAAGLKGVPGIRVPLPREGAEHAFYRLYAAVEPDALAGGWDRDRIALAVAAEGVAVQQGACAELYREQAAADAGLAPEAPLPNASRTQATSLAFQVHPALSDADIDDTAEAVRRVFAEAAR